MSCYISQGQPSAKFSSASSTMVAPWQSTANGGASNSLWHLCLHPWDFLLNRSQFWEWWQTSGLVLVVDQLSLSICSSNMEAAARAHQWSSLASMSSHSPKCSAFLSGMLCLNGEMDEHWWAQILYLLLTAHILSAIGSLSRKTKYPWLPPAPILAHTVGVWATSLACILDGRGPQFLLWKSSTPQATIKVSHYLWPTNYTFSYTIKQGATFHAFYFTTVDKNMQPSGLARS